MGEVVKTILNRHPRVTSLMERLIDRPAESHAELITITPEECRSILEHRNPRNRKLSQKRRDSLAEILKAGIWRVNGETIIFGSDGNLLDGQGRLAASALSGIPMKSWVVFGIDPSSFDVIDRGKKRSLADDLSIDGEENTGLLASALSILWLEVHERLDRVGKAESVPSPAARELLAQHSDLRKSVKVGAATSKILIPSIGTYLHYRFASLDTLDANRFFDDLRRGANLRENDPVLLLRNRLLTDRDEGKTRLLEPLCLTIKAWNLRRSGRWVRLSWRAAEGVPIPV